MVSFDTYVTIFDSEQSFKPTMVKTIQNLIATTTIFNILTFHKLTPNRSCEPAKQDNNPFASLRWWGRQKYLFRPPEGQPAAALAALCKKNFAQTLHPDRKKKWRSDFNKEFGIVHFEHQTIENTALPATCLRQVNPMGWGRGGTVLTKFFENIANFRNLFVSWRRLQSKLPNR